MRDDTYCCPWCWAVGPTGPTGPTGATGALHIFVYNHVLIAVVKPGDMILNDCALIGDAFRFV